ncbi:MAG TPA: aldo/keto reductase [Planctomycetaceae bacterium]|nr:aldo/keto reductase [Planctomycetaceae bacterium]
MSGVPSRPLGKTELDASAIAFGSFKIGRNEGIKYPNGYDLPDDSACEALLNAVLDLGITLIDTAPAYGIAEERIGKFLSARRDEYLLSSKAGERFENGVSTYEFTAKSLRESVESSLRKLKTDHLDLLLVHTHHDDMSVLSETPTVETFERMKAEGLTHFIGFSGKTVAAAEQALDWADVLMVEFNSQDTSHEDVIRQAHQRGVGVLVKKGLASGHLPPHEAIEFVLQNEAVDSLVLGGSNIEHLRANCELANRIRPG